MSLGPVLALEAQLLTRCIPRSLSLACKSLSGTLGAGHVGHCEREDHHQLTRFYSISTLLKWYRACAGELLSREILRNRGADAVPVSGRLHPISRQGKRYGDLARSKNLSMYRNTSRENRELPCLPVNDGAAGRIGKSQDVSQ